MNRLRKAAGRCTGPLLLVLLAGLLTACVNAPQTTALLRERPAQLAPQVRLADVPFFAQDAYQCGPAALAMTLQHSGIGIAPEALVSAVYVPARKGSFQVEMLAATRAQGRLALTVTPTMASLLGWLDAGEPVLVLQNLGTDWYPVWHYAVVIGYDLDARKMILHTGVTENYHVSMATFELTWARSSYWGLVTLKPGELPYRDDPDRYFHAAADLEESQPATAMQAVWTAGVSTWPQRPDLALGLANLYYRRGDSEAALAAYRGIVERFPDYLPGYNNLASLQVELGDTEGAIATASAGLAVAGGSNPYLEQTLAEARASRAGRESP
ncbi:PA2778 family cysteine peptidase [Haliea sp. E17]|uniref:PA2778 family cysteine peptidase n=1 Tax=Haliea sp. E17 TaxID=3401576 RepID=UPI003AAFE343